MSLEEVRLKIMEACKLAGRYSEDVTLVGVTKLKSVEHIRSAYELGLRDFGENYLQEALEKIETLSDLDICWHYVGKLQTKKIKDIVGRFAWIHSLDDLGHAEEIQKRAQQKQNVLVQINLGGEASKGGIPPGDLEGFLAVISEHDKVQVQGLMSMPPLEENLQSTRENFKILRELAQHFGLEHLSMGTSSDYGVAVEEGATMVRVGREIFGERQ